MLGSEDTRAAPVVSGIELTECENSTVRAIRMMDKAEFSDAREELMKGISSQKDNVAALLLMRFLRLDQPQVFGPTDISADDMLSRAQKAGPESRERATVMCDYLSKALSESPSALFLCGSLAEKVQNDMDSAFLYYRKSGERGCAAAQFNIGCFYSSGTGVDVDKAEAAQWFELAANQGRANAQNNLGVLYLTGQGVPQDRKKAAELFRAASKQGHANARQNYLMAVRPVGNLKLPTAKEPIPEAPLVSPREEMEPWNPTGGNGTEDVPLNGLNKPRKRRWSFSNRFFGGN